VTSSREPLQAFRSEYRATQIGPHYSGWGHFLFTTTGALLAIGAAGLQLRHVHGAEWLTLPVAFLIANFAEYLGHRGAMHRPRRGLGLLYRRHTQQHHHFFTHTTMSAESPRDFKMVLFPPVMLLFFLGCLATPIGALLYFAISPNTGLLFAMVAMGYFLTYEWLHFSYHLRPDSLVGRLPLIGTLRRHHTRHHDLALMGRWNFNITFPIADWIFGTSYPEVAADARVRTPREPE